MYGASHFADLIGSGNELPATPCKDHVKYRHFIYGDVYSVNDKYTSGEVTFCCR